MINKNEESQWQKASASLDASAKIYGYRVDCVHSDTFRVLGSLNRTDTNDKIAEKEEQIQRERREKIYPTGKNDGSSTLERDLTKLDCMKFDMEFDVDPLFTNMTAKFNETGARGLLLNNLPIDEHLDILLESKEERYKTQSQDKFLSEELAGLIQKSFYVDRGEFESTLIFPDIDYFKNQTDRKINPVTDKMMEKSFANITIKQQEIKKRRDAKNKALEKIKIDMTDEDNIIQYGNQSVNVNDQTVNLPDQSMAIPQEDQGMEPMDDQPLDYHPIDYNQENNLNTSFFAGGEAEGTPGKKRSPNSSEGKKGSITDEQRRETLKTSVKKIKRKDNDEYDYSVPK